jgi:hypothetical protein
LNPFSLWINPLPCLLKPNGKRTGLKIPETFFEKLNLSAMG